MQRAGLDVTLIAAREISQAGYTAREDVIWARAETAEAISFGRRFIATMRKEDHREDGCRKPREASRAR